MWEGSGRDGAGVGVVEGAWGANKGRTPRHFFVLESKEWEERVVYV